MKNNKLSNKDEWFISSLNCLIGAEKFAVKIGSKKNIDTQKIKKWIIKNS